LGSPVLEELPALEESSQLGEEIGIRTVQLKPSHMAATEVDTAVARPVDMTGGEAAGTEGLMIRVSGESWLDVRDGTGRTLYSGLIQGSRAMELMGAAPYSLVIGDINVVGVMYQGETVPLRPHARGKVARLTIPIQR
jgi:cytoskeleton protein RodZ